MMKASPFRPLLARLVLGAASLLVLRAAADTIELSNGARLVGKIKQIHVGTITIETDFAGELKVKQSLVTKITTDKPVAVRFSDGSGQIGVVSAPATDKVAVTNPGRTTNVTVGNVAAIWPAGDPDPDVVALRRKWTYEVDLDISGRTGTDQSLGTALGYKAQLAGPLDTFKYYLAYNRQETEGEVSADQFKAGVDYSDLFTARVSWYVRDEAGFDRVNDIDFYDIAAAGLGYDFLKAPNQTLTGRAGISYRYDEYTPPTAALSSAGLDFELEYTYKFKNSQFHDKITFVPAFENLNNYIITHEASYEIPLAKSLWKLSMGLSNNYNSQPVPGVDRLDTLYFTRLVLVWGEGAPK